MYKWKKEQQRRRTILTLRNKHRGLQSLMYTIYSLILQQYFRLILIYVET
jgi:hypothetical protein